MHKKGGIFLEGIEEGINEIVRRPSEVFREIEEFGVLNNIPILSPASGSVLLFLMKVYNPKHILELGTGAGYSTLWMLNGIDKSSKLISIDRNSELQAQAEKFVRRAGFGESQAEFVNGNSIEYLDLNLQKLKHFDLIFIDCDKVDYPTLLDFFITEKLNATLIFDNALWHGRIFSDNPEKPSDRAMVKFWEMIESSGREFTLFPAGDGLVAIGQTAFKTN